MDRPASRLRRLGWVVGGTLTGALAVANASVVAERIQAVGGNAERRARLSNGDARDLPTAENCMGKSIAAEKRQTVDVADREVVAQIEIRTGPIGGKVVRIDERGVAPVGRIVYGMAVGVGHA